MGPNSVTCDFDFSHFQPSGNRLQCHRDSRPHFRFLLDAVHPTSPPLHSPPDRQPRQERTPESKQNAQVNPHLHCDRCVFNASDDIDNPRPPNDIAHRTFHYPLPTSDDINPAYYWHQPRTDCFLLIRTQHPLHYGPDEAALEPDNLAHVHAPPCTLRYPILSSA